MAVFIPNLDLTCRDLGSSSLNDCTFRVVDCEATSTKGVFTGVGDIWNNNLCQTDFCYNMAVPAGSKFMLQTQFVDFYHPDPLSPTDGWGTWINIEMYGADDVLISNVIANIASRWGVGVIGGNSIQTIEIDTSLSAFSGVSNFYFKIQTLDDTLAVVDEVVTQHFAFLEPCEQYVKLTSRYPGFDCLNNWYGEFDAWVSPVAEFKYENTFWIRGRLLDGEDNVSKDTFGDRVTQSTLIEAFDLIMTSIVPAWEKNRVSKMWAPGAEVYIDDDFYRIDSLSIDNKLTTLAGRMFLFNVALTKECILNYRCITLDQPTSTIVVPPVVVEQCVECVDVSCIGP